MSSELVDTRSEDDTISRLQSQRQGTHDGRRSAGMTDKTYAGQPTLLDQLPDCLSNEPVFRFNMSVFVIARRPVEAWSCQNDDGDALLAKGSHGNVDHVIKGKEHGPRCKALFNGQIAANKY